MKEVRPPPPRGVVICPRGVGIAVSIQPVNPTTITSSSSLSYIMKKSVNDEDNKIFTRLAY